MRSGGPADPFAGPVADVAVIGGGPAGVRCSIGLAEAGVFVALFERQSLGGQLVNARMVEGLTDDADAASGPELSGDLAEEVYDSGVQIELTDVTSVAHYVDLGWWMLATSSSSLRARTLVLATGSRPRPLAVPGADRLTGRGVSYCATCDGPLFRGKSVVIVMRDEWSADEAVQLADSATSVVALLDPEYDAALERHLGRLEGLPVVEIRPSSRAVEVIGDDVVAGIRASDATGESSWDTDGIFCSLGVDPETELVTGLLTLDAAGGVVIDDAFEASAPEVYAIGEVRAASPHSARHAMADGEALARHLVTRLGG